MIGLVIVGLAAAAALEWVTRSQAIDYQRIERDPYPDQVTVKRYPGVVSRLWGAKSTEAIYVAKDWVYYAGWYEIPDMVELSIIHPIITEFHRVIRQIKYTESKTA